VALFAVTLTNLPLVVRLSEGGGDNKVTLVKCMNMGSGGKRYSNEIVIIFHCAFLEVIL